MSKKNKKKKGLNLEMIDRKQEIKRKRTRKTKCDFNMNWTPTSGINA